MKVTKITIELDYDASNADECREAARLAGSNGKPATPPRQLDIPGLAIEAKQEPPAKPTPQHGDSRKKTTAKSDRREVHFGDMLKSDSLQVNELFHYTMPDGTSVDAVLRVDGALYWGPHWLGTQPGQAERALLKLCDVQMPASYRGGSAFRNWRVVRYGQEQPLKIYRDLHKQWRAVNDNQSTTGRDGDPSRP